MTHLSIIASFLKRPFLHENGAAVVVAIPGSLSLKELLAAVIADTSVKDLVLPLLLAAVSLILYFLVFILDFISGVKASKFEAVDKNNFFSSSKGWSSIWKLSAVFLLVTWSSFFSILAALGDLAYLADFFMLAAGGISIMATLLDIFSIGENQKRLTGKKAKFFEWLEGLMKLINEGFINKIRKLFSG